MSTSPKTITVNDKNSNADYKTIKAAINSASNGDTIEIKANGFRYEEKIEIKNKPGLKIQSDFKPQSGNMRPVIVGSGIKIKNCPNLQFCDINIDGSGGDGHGCEIVDSKEVLIKNSQIANCGKTGIRIENSDNVDLYNVGINNTRRHGIFVINSHNSKFKLVMVSYSRHHGIFVEDSNSLTIKHSDIYYSKRTGLASLNSSVFITNSKFRGNNPGNYRRWAGITFRRNNKASSIRDSMICGNSRAGTSDPATQIIIGNPAREELTRCRENPGSCCVTIENCQVDETKIVDRGYACKKLDNNKPCPPV